jgi:transposase
MIAKSLEGDYRPEHLFALRQSLAAFHYYQQLVVEVDQEIQRQLGSLETATTAEPTLPKRTKASAYQRRRYEAKTFDLRSELYRIFGVDLTNVPGISAITAQTILCEIGTDVSRFRNASAFASWLGLCPENKISGGKVLYTKSRRVRSRVATALRMDANSLHHAKDYLGEFFRRITRKLGKPQAITATAHKLARIVYHLLSTKEAYNETVFHRCDEEALRRAQFRLRRQAPHSWDFNSSLCRTDDVPWESASDELFQFLSPLGRKTRFPKKWLGMCPQMPHCQECRITNVNARGKDSRV